MSRTLLLCLCMWRLCSTDEVKLVSVMEGDSVFLHVNLTELQRRDQIEWIFGPQETLIARINEEFNKVSIFDDVHDGMFRHRLQVDAQTGSLTITNITTQHSGLYHMITSSSTTETSYTFSVTVYARLPVPVISRNSSQCSSSSERSSNCSLLCSVLNVSHVSLSWYKGSSLLSSISVSDLNIRLSLPLEVDYEDTNTHTCVLNNTIMNHTQHLHITQHCHKCSAHPQPGCCDATEAVIRLVLSVLVGVAAVAFLIYDITVSRVEPKRRSKVISKHTPVTTP